MMMIDAQGMPSDDPKTNSETGLTALSLTVGSPGNSSSAFEDAIMQISQISEFVDAKPESFHLIRNSSDLGNAMAAKKLGLIYNLQDTAPIGPSLDRIALFHGLGIRILQLTYNKRNLAGDGALESSDAGLSDLGRQTISEINRLRIVLDLSHGGRRTTAEALAEARRPPIISHSGCKAICEHPRNVADMEMKALAEKGGVFGIYFMPFLRSKGQPTPEDLIRHIEHAHQICGEEHIGIGTDGGVERIVINEEYRAYQRKFYEERKAQGIAAPGEAADVFNFILEYNGPRKYMLLAQDLKKRGWPTSRIEKLMGGNFARVFGEVWG